MFLKVNHLAPKEEYEILREEKSLGEKLRN